MRAFFLLSTLSTALFLACSQPVTSGTTSTSTGSGGAGGAGGACPMGPQAMFDLTITAQDGDVPPSTTIAVSWSAGEEPKFRLDQPATWMTIDQANVVCDVDASEPPPDKLAALVCHLWTTGATNVVVTAKGYTTFEMTYASTFSDHCKALVPTAISIQLEPTPKDDAGPM
ncbi:MAG: hypothetical protein ABJE95_26660 [Byssovorax sp.]